ncbi:MAG: 50S ribosomal protein L25/general stress protein Ctc [Actinobacteria bacterium]|jgi:large subunit ribosomal protein L25|nr:50S ribosomal protein L25/general stress protein Ctc [Actinomycetota bacterium]NCV41845.1 50S ribosomal protein L25/general stress protein Ctc [Actinomycetota bacterium]NCV82302.1 50S ribosomal protein L25/general stress protein Ctc [Actinomycetota bacterium]NCW42991.1 50S ribosomal protein L25/general stress protein Ctc [Actinomycetota bacterium]NCW72254.1 50S ribosomal protein L25/general stress protein Ctc [Actinomycetota bacterium]
MAEISINGVRRTEFGKGASRRARRDGLVPAVIYGHGEKPQHITLPARELGVALKQSNVLLDISIDGKTELTLPKAIVRHPLKQILEHVDLVLVRRGEKVVVSVPVHAIGEHDRDGILEHVHNSIEVRVEATAIPSFLEVSIEGMHSGESRYASDVKLPAGVELESDPKTIVVHLSEKSTVVEEVVAPVAAATDAAAPAEDAEKKDA